MQKGKRIGEEKGWDEKGERKQGQEKEEETGREPLLEYIISHLGHKTVETSDIWLFTYLFLPTLPHYRNRFLLVLAINAAKEKK